MRIVGFLCGEDVERRKRKRSLSRGETLLLSLRGERGNYRTFLQHCSLWMGLFCCYWFSTRDVGGLWSEMVRWFFGGCGLVLIVWILG